MGFCLGGNLFGSNPDAQFAAAALARLDSLVYLNTTLNTGHAHGLARETLILPVLARDEEPQPTTQESMFNFVRLSEGGARRHEGPRSEVEIIAHIAGTVLGNSTPIDWHAMTDTSQIRATIAQVVPGFEKIGELDRTRQEFHVEGRTLHTPRFPTASGRARLYCHTLPSLAGADDELRLMTVRSEGQFNTVVYEEQDLYRGQDRRDVILMHPEDVARLGLRQDQGVRVSSRAGEMTNILVREFPDIRAGNVLMYYPEANVLVPRTADAQSRTPAFKSIPVRVAPMELVTAGGHRDAKNIALAQATPQTSGSGVDG
jgi:anaerobic selenocysteine-containing dehydrogenase